METMFIVYSVTIILYGFILTAKGDHNPKHRTSSLLRIFIVGLIPVVNTIILMYMLKRAINRRIG